MAENVAIVTLAVLLDLALGEPRNALHPVAWLGRLVGWARGVAPNRTIFIMWWGRWWPS